MIFFCTYKRTERNRKKEIKMRERRKHVTRRDDIVMDEWAGTPFLSPFPHPLHKTTYTLTLTTGVDEIYCKPQVRQIFKNFNNFLKWDKLIRGSALPKLILVLGGNFFSW